jgi:NitT/TauT family transport system substrate-binding protein
LVLPSFAGKGLAMSRAVGKVLLVVFVVAAVCLVTVVLCWGGTPARKQEDAPRPRALRISYNPYLTNAPLFVARDEGYFAQQGVPALTSGQIDVLSGPVNAGVLNAIARGARLKMVADKGYVRPGACATCVVCGRREYAERGTPDNPEQIKRMALCCDPDGMRAYLMDKVLAPHGLTLRDLKLVRVPPASYAEALEQGTADAAVAAEPWATRLTEAGYPVLWVADQGVAPEAQLAYLAFGPALLDDDPQLGREFMVAYLEAVRQLAEGKTDRNVDILTRGTGLDRGLVEKACWTDFRENGRLNVDSVLDFQRWALGAGLVDATLSPEQFWDPSFVDYANRALRAAE